MTNIIYETSRLENSTAPSEHVVPGAKTQDSDGEPPTKKYDFEQSNKIMYRLIWIYMEYSFFAYH